MESIHIQYWYRKAKCYGIIDDVMFFPSNAHEAEKGKRFCSDCPVSNHCKTYAIVYNLVGVWGGTSHKERVRLGPKVRKYLIELYRELGCLDEDLLATRTLTEVHRGVQQRE